MRRKISALGRRLRSRATLQFKFSLSYILVIAAVLYKPLKKYILGQDLLK